MKKIFYIIALGIALAGCSNNEDELLSTGSFPEDHVIRVITEVNEPLSRAGYDAMNLERFGLMIRNSENAAYNYHKQMVGSGSAAYGQGWDMDAIAACVVGGVSFTGGIGKISGVVTGVLIFTSLTYALTILGIDTNLQFIFEGIIILAAVTLDCLKYVQKK